MSKIALVAVPTMVNLETDPGVNGRPSRESKSGNSPISNGEETPRWKRRFISAFVFGRITVIAKAA